MSLSDRRAGGGRGQVRLRVRAAGVELPGRAAGPGHYQDTADRCRSPLASRSAAIVEIGARSGGFPLVSG